MNTDEQHFVSEDSLYLIVDLCLSRTSGLLLEYTMNTYLHTEHVTCTRVGGASMPLPPQQVKCPRLTL